MPARNGVMAATAVMRMSDPRPADTVLDSVTVKNDRWSDPRDHDFPVAKRAIPLCHDDTYVRPNPAPAAGDPGAGSGGIGQPGFRPALHRPHGDGPLEPNAGLARCGGRAVPPGDARSGRHGPALRAGDLRRAQGLPPAERVDRDLPARVERGPVPRFG